jgi:hypothetical protein
MPGEPAQGSSICMNHLGHGGIGDMLQNFLGVFNFGFPDDQKGGDGTKQREASSGIDG